jgi:hypothetical protein
MTKFWCLCLNGKGTWWRSCLRYCGRSRVQFCMGLLGFLVHLIIPEVDSNSNRNEYQEYLLEGKDGRCVELTT